MLLNRRVAMLGSVSTLVGGCAIAAPAPGTEAEQALERVFATEAQFAIDAEAMGIVPAFRRYVGPNAIMFLPEPVIINPRLETANWPGTIQWRPAFAIVSSVGDVVVTTGPSVWRVGESADYGYFFTVWLRQDDGAYRFVVDGSATMRENLLTSLEDTPERLFANSGALAVIDTAEADFHAHASQDDSEAIASRFEPRGRLLRPARPPGVGPSAARAALSARSARYQRQGGGAATSNDLAWSYGLVEWADGARGVYTRVWRYDGRSWRIALDNVAPL